MNKIIKNYIYTALYQLIIVINPIITMPYKARTLGPDNIGIYSYVISVYQYLLLFSAIGINVYGRREIAYVKDDKTKTSKLLYELIILKLILSISTILIFYLTFGLNSKYLIYYLIFIPDLLFNIFDLTWFYQGLEQFKKISIINVISKTINIFFIFIFIKTESDLLNYFIITIIFDIIPLLVYIITIKKYIKRINIKILKIFRHFKTCLILFIPLLLIQIYTVFNKILLGNMITDISEVGYYDYSYRIISIAINLISSFALVMIPIISKEYKNKNNKQIKKYMNNSLKFILVISIPLTLGLIGISDNLVYIIFGKDYLSMANLIKILSFIIVPIGITTMIGQQYLIPTKQEKKFTIYILIGTIINVLLNLILIPKFSSIGTSISTVITELAILLIEIPIIKKVINKDIIKSILKYTLSSIIMFIIVYLIGLTNQTPLILIIQIIVGITTYMLFLIITKDDFLKELKLRK